MSDSYVAVVPVKPPGQGKTRLGDLPRDELAAAFALDTVTACLAARSIERTLVVTDDAVFAQRFVDLGCSALPDGVTGDLNATLSLAAVEAVRRWPGLVPVALCADLPCLTSDEVDAALAQRPGWPRFAADAKGRGTTLYTAPLAEFAPRFGKGSAARHAEGGAWPLDGALPGLRHDVDDAEDLRAALELGLGAHSRLVVARI